MNFPMYTFSFIDRCFQSWDTPYTCNSIELQKLSYNYVIASIRNIYQDKIIPSRCKDSDTSSFWLYLPQRRASSSGFPNA